jgi:branched-subunit amino acid transport protein
VEADVTTWIVILAVGAGSFVFRVIPLSVASRISVSERFDRTLRHAATAALGALLATSFDHSARTGNDVALAVASGIALVLSLRGSSMPRVVGVGAASYLAAVVALGLLP